LTSIRQTRIAGVFLRDNTRRRDQGIRQSGFALFIERVLIKKKKNRVVCALPR